MAMPIRATEYESAIWKNFSRAKPKSCPDCCKEDTLEYIGFASNYTKSLQAKMYRCSACDAWIDCVWPKWSGVAEYQYPLAAPAAVG